jgi:membrane protein
MERNYKAICAVTTVFLCGIFWAVGGIPTDIEDIILIFACIYFPFLFPILISISGIRMNYNLVELNKIKTFIKFSFIYNFVGIPIIWWTVAHWNFGLTLYMFVNIFGVEFISFIIHAFLLIEAKSKYEELKSENQDKACKDEWEEKVAGKKKAYKSLKKLVITVVMLTAVMFGYRQLSRFIIVKEIEKEPPIIFSAYFGADKGTFIYYLGNQGLIRVSDYVFKSLSYNEDKTKIVGVIDEKYGFNGIAELDLSDNSFREVLNLEEINNFAENNGLDTFDLSSNYLNVDRRIRCTKYCKDFYTFIYDGNICMLSDKGGSKDIKIIRKKDESDIYSYYIDKNNKDIIYIEEEKYENDKAKILVLKENLKDKSSEILMTRKANEYMAEGYDGLMEISDDMEKLIYYKSPYIFSYDLKSGARKDIARQRLITKQIIEIKLSEDKQYLLYTIGEQDTFIGITHRDTFCVVDLKTKSRVYLKRWEVGDYFFAFDW